MRIDSAASTEQRSLPRSPSSSVAASAGFLTSSNGTLAARAAR